MLFSCYDAPLFAPGRPPLGDGAHCDVPAQVTNNASLVRPGAAGGGGAAPGASEIFLEVSPEHSFSRIPSGNKEFGQSAAHQSGTSGS